MKSLVVLVALFAVSLFSGVEAQRRPFMSWGPNKTSCGSYLAEDKASRQPLDSWVLGFVSGINYERADGNKPDLAVTDVEGVKAWVAKYCGEHPLDAFTTAMVALATELANRTEAK